MSELDEGAYIRSYTWGVKVKDIEVFVSAFGESKTGTVASLDVGKIIQITRQHSETKKRTKARHLSLNTLVLKLMAYVKRMKKGDDIFPGENTIFDTPHTVSYCATVELRICQQIISHNNFLSQYIIIINTG